MSYIEDLISIQNKKDLALKLCKAALLSCTSPQTYNHDLIKQALDILKEVEI